MKKPSGKAKPTQSSSCWEFTLMPRHCHCLLFLILPAKEPAQPASPSLLPTERAFLGGDLFIAPSPLLTESRRILQPFRIQLKALPGAIWIQDINCFTPMGSTQGKVAARIVKPSKLSWQWKVEVFHSQTAKPSAITSELDGDK